MKPNVLMHLSAARHHMGGGSISMWRVAEELARRGYQLKVTASQIMTSIVRGVHVARLCRADFRWARVILTVSGSAGRAAYRQPRVGQVPVVSFVHSATRALHCEGASLVVWGSQAIHDRACAKGYRSATPNLVLWPPIDAERMKVMPGDRVTLVNLMPEKGAHLFWQIVKQMPDVSFLGVRGGWDLARQVVPSPMPANAEVMRFARDPRRVYARTKVLLYLRGKDAGPNWLNGVGMTALEAAVSGIPTIAHPGPGLIESLGEAGTWVDSDDPGEWAAAIRRTLEPAQYAERSRIALERATRLNPPRGMDELVAAIERLSA